MNRYHRLLMILRLVALIILGLTFLISRFAHA